MTPKRGRQAVRAAGWGRVLKRDRQWAADLTDEFEARFDNLAAEVSAIDRPDPASGPEPAPRPARRRAETPASEARSPMALLTDQERAIGGMVASGMTDSAIAVTLALRKQEIGAAIRVLMTKLEVQTRPALAERILREGTVGDAASSLRQNEPIDMSIVFGSGESAYVELKTPMREASSDSMAGLLSELQRSVEAAKGISNSPPHGNLRYVELFRQLIDSGVEDAVAVVDNNVMVKMGRQLRLLTEETPEQAHALAMGLSISELMEYTNERRPTEEPRSRRA